MPLQRTPPTKATWNRLSFCDELLAAAEKELAAFATAVHQRFGPEQARQSSEDWLEELASLDWSAQTSVPDLLALTIAAADKLARRMCSPS